MEFLQTSKGILLTQRKYIQELPRDFLPSGSRSSIAPLESSTKIHHSSSVPLDDPSSYKKLVGKLNFLVNSRLDLAFTVQHLCQFMQSPISSHWNAAIHTLQYLQGTANLGVLFPCNTNFTLQAYCDSVWASCPTTRKSVSGFYVSLGGAPISWKSKKQVMISLSPTEAEYRSLRRVTAELGWLSRLLHELGVPNVQLIPVHSESQSAIYIAKNPVFHERTKHVELDCHFIREKLLDGLVSLSHVPTSLQLVDVFTKALPGPVHSSSLSKLGLIFQVPSPT